MRASLLLFVVVSAGCDDALPDPGRAPPSRSRETSDAAVTVSCGDDACAALTATIGRLAERPVWTWGGVTLRTAEPTVALDTPTDAVSVLEVAWSSEDGGGSAAVAIAGSAIDGESASPGVTIVALGGSCSQIPVTHLGGCLHDGQILTAQVTYPGSGSPGAIVQLNTLGGAPPTLFKAGVDWARWSIGAADGSADAGGDPWVPGVVGAPTGAGPVDGDHLVYWLALPEGSTTIDLLHEPGAWADSLVQVKCAGGLVAAVAAQKR